MRTGRRFAIAMAALALILFQAMPVMAAGNGKGGSQAQEHGQGGKQQVETTVDPSTTVEGDVAPAVEDSSTVETKGNKPEDKGNKPADKGNAASDKAAGDVTADESGAAADQQVNEKGQTAAQEKHVQSVKAQSREAAKALRAENQVTGPYIVYVNGDRLNLTPLAHNGRTLVPYRALSEYLGATVSWDQASKTVTVVADGKTVKLTIGSTTAYVDGQPVELEVAPELVDGSTFVPVRFIAEALGADVDYDPETGAITVITLDGVEPTQPADDTAPADGGTTTAPADGGTTTAPADGGTTTAPADGGTTTAPADGGTTTAPADGGTTTAPADGGTTVTP